MPVFKDVAEQYAAIGATGVIVVAFIIAFFMILRNAKIDRDQHREDMAAKDKAQAEQTKQTALLIQNNTAAMGELARSSENVATAMQMIRQGQEAQCRLMESHDLRCDSMARDIMEIKGALNKT